MKVLTSPSSIGQISSEPFDLLEKHGIEIINNPFGRKLTEDEVIELAKDCVGIVAGVEPLTARVMDALPKLKCISRVGVGMDSVDLVYAETKGIKVVNTPDGPTRGVAELTLSLTMSLLRRIPQADAALKERRWQKVIGNLLIGKIVGVVGLGRIGRMTAEIFRALGNEVIGYDLYPNEEWANQNGVKVVAQEELFKTADIITLHIPGNNDGSPAIGSDQLLLMHSEAVLINVARGGVVDEDILFDLLFNGKIKGAAIDVFSEEPYSGKFCDLENVVLTPHLGSYAKEGKLKMEVDAVKNLLAELKN